MSNSGLSREIELWGGPECTVNRVRNSFFDQCERSGHSRRLDDLERFAALGIRTLRYPILWEWVQPENHKEFRWDWADERLGKLRQLGIRPIVGLLHHGSGPRWTSLIAEDFAERFAEFASAVARRFPWIDAWTPINEPLTTARFCCIYGHWHPHRTDDLSFFRALMNELRASVLAMQAIRGANPEAQWIQTEDLGKAFSTPKMRYQAEFENERRWFTFDALSGELTPAHRMWQFARGCGVSEEELLFFWSNKIQPQVLGINYYLTSERFLDESLEKFPSCFHGRNAFETFSDVPSVRVRAEGLFGVHRLLLEAARRFKGRRLAVTEAHAGCTREEQVRWLHEVWHAAHEARRNGADVCAVTSWALLGAFDWDSLVTVQSGNYESGAFDLRSPVPRPTAVARAVRSITESGDVDEPFLGGLGWWRRPIRLNFEPQSAPDPLDGFSPRREVTWQPKILVFGGHGTLGQALGRIASIRGLSHRLVSKEETDICDIAAVQRAIEKYEPWAVINAAGYGLVDEAEFNEEECRRIHVRGSENLASVCAAFGARLVAFSSDLVFDGFKAEPYVESDTPRPLSAFGRSKHDAERAVLDLAPDALVIRTSCFFGPWDRSNFAIQSFDESLMGEEVIAIGTRISPTYLPDLVNRALDLLIDRETGLWHLTNVGAVTWAEFAALLRAKIRQPQRPVRVVARNEWLAERPAQSVLSSERGRLMPTLESAIDRFAADCTALAARAMAGSRWDP